MEYLFTFFIYFAMMFYSYDLEPEEGALVRIALTFIYMIVYGIILEEKKENE